MRPRAPVKCRMTTKATASNEPVGRLLGWLGLRRPRGSAPHEGSSAPPDPGGPRFLAREARYELAASITSFLVHNDLDVYPAHPLLAPDAFSGPTPRLPRQLPPPA